jgi:hypothetical protein
MMEWWTRPSIKIRNVLVTCFISLKDIFSLGLIGIWCQRDYGLAAKELNGHDGSRDYIYNL